MNDDIELIERRMASARTLRGARGERLWNIPGVVYPAAVIQSAAEGKTAKRPQKTIPQGYISTAEAAEMLEQRTHSAARNYMHHHGIPCRFVQLAAAPATSCYWKRAAVEKLAASKPPLFKEIPEGFINSEHARAMLRASRASLFRYVEGGFLSMMKVRLQEDRKTRIVSLYPIEEVQALAETSLAARAAGEAYKEALKARKKIC